MAKDDITKVKATFNGLRNVISKLGKSSDPLLFALALKWMAGVYLPYIPLSDGGRARGRMVGLLNQFGVRLPDSVVHDKTHAGSEDKLDSKEFAEGVREGRMISPQGAKVKLEILFNRHKKALKIKDLKDKTGLLKELHTRIQELIKKGAP